MAIRGVSLTEKEAIIHPDDPGHPDNIKVEIERRLSRKAGITREDDQKAQDEKIAALGSEARDNIKNDIEQDEQYKPTTYYIGNLTANDRTELGDMVATPIMRGNSIEMAPRNNERITEIVRRGLKGWDNQQDVNGKIVEFKLTTTTDSKGRPLVVCSDASIAALPTFVVNWLAEEIQKKNGMTADLAKKFSGASQQFPDLISALGDVPNVPSNSAANEDAPSQQSEE